MTVETIKKELSYARRWSTEHFNLDDAEKLSFLVREVERLQGVLAAVKAKIEAYELSQRGTSS